MNSVDSSAETVKVQDQEPPLWKGMALGTANVASPALSIVGKALPDSTAKEHAYISLDF